MALVLFSRVVFAQAVIPNGGFENWAGGKPASWGTSDDVLMQIGQPDAGTAEQDTLPANVFAGSSSIRLTNKHVTTPIGDKDIPGVVNLGVISLNLLTLSPEVTGYSYTDRPDSIRFAAKYTSGPTGTDSGNVAATLTRWTPNGTLMVARSVVRIPANASFSVFSVKLDYNSVQAPDTLLIQAIATSSQANMVLESQLWVDDFSFVGLDTTFKAYINPDVALTACDGDSVLLATDPSVNDSYQWHKNNTTIGGAGQPLYKAVASGSYFVEVNHAGTIYTSDTVNVIFNPAPSVSFTVDASQDTLCSNAATVLLIGGAPAGGFYTGNAVTNSHFNPSSAGPGLSAVTYTVTSAAGCNASATQNIYVTTCTGIETNGDEAQITLYPNPAADNFYLTAKDFSGEESEVWIFNGLGETVFQSNFSRAAINAGVAVNCLAFANGIYLLELRGMEKQWTTRFVVSK